MRLRRLKAVPRPLVALLAAVLVLGVTWAVLLPPWQAPDEDAHFAYTQVLSERFELPGAVPTGSTFSSEWNLAAGYSYVYEIRAITFAKPNWSEGAYERWQRDERTLPSSAEGDGRGPNPAGVNPPLYYLTSAIGYLAASGGDVFDRAYATRIVSVLLLLVTVSAAWLFAAELFPRDRRLQLVAAAVVGLQPMETFTSASVSPDALLFATWALALWLGTRVLVRGATWRSLLALGLAVGLAVPTKATSYALLVPVAFVFLVALWRGRSLGAGRLAALVAPGAAAVAVPILAWLGTARALDRVLVNPLPAGEPGVVAEPGIRQFASYVWQYYLPKLGFMEPRLGPQLEHVPVYEIWLKNGWANFGWLDTRLPGLAYTLIGSVVCAFAALGVIAAVRARRTIDWAVPAFLGLALLTLLAGLHWVEYRHLLATGQLINQGRYLLPLLPILGIVVAAAITLAPSRFRGLAVGAVLAALFTLQIFSLWWVTLRFYA